MATSYNVHGVVGVDENMFIPICGTCPDSALGPPSSAHAQRVLSLQWTKVRLPPHSTSHYLHEMSPITRGMARKGVRHYAPYNLRSRGPDQTLLDLSTLPPTPRTPVRPYNAVGARAAVPALHVQAAEGNPPANVNEFIYPDIRKAIRDGEPLQAVGFGIKLRFVQDCFELAKAVDEEQKKMLRALEADEVVSQEKLDMFGQHELDYVEKCAEIAVEVIANDIQNMLQLANGTASASSTTNEQR